MDRPHNISSAPALTIYIRQGGVDTLTVSESARNFASIPVDSSITAPERILEEAVYANPDLLGDFRCIDVIADSTRFIVCPDAVGGQEQLAGGIAAKLWQDCDPDSLIIERCAAGTVSVSAFDRSLSSFVNRTFPRARLHHRLASLIDFFASLSRPVNKIKLFAHLAASRLDLIASSADSLLMANTFDCSDNADALYFIMAAVKDMGFDPLDDELVICGGADWCAALTDSLRRYLNSVMPLLLPAPENELPLELLKYYRS